MTSLVGTSNVRGYRRSALLRGAASALDLRGQTLAQYRIVQTPEEEDGEAIRDDWRQVGADLQEAMDTFVCPVCGRRQEDATDMAEAAADHVDQSKAHAAARRR